MKGDHCVMTPVSVRCADGSMPVGGTCTITGMISMRCPPGSVQINENECQMLEPPIRYTCPDGSYADYNNVCPINMHQIVYECPPGKFFLKVRLGLEFHNEKYLLKQALMKISWVVVSLKFKVVLE